ncbi:hypothetical protein [Paenibacillus sp. CAA11]|nr:hypothetical protein [Paenibacillus sp. CAA11]
MAFNAQAEPGQDQRFQLAEEVMNMIKAANQAGDTSRLRQELPPADAS